MNSIISDNTKYFKDHPLRKKAAEKYKNTKNRYFEAVYDKDFLMLIEMIFNQNVKQYVASDRIILIDDEKVRDTNDILKS